MRAAGLRYRCGMATKPIPTTKVILVTSQEPTTATLTQGSTSITWTALTESGQTTIIVPAGATLSLSSPSALISPLPFEGALAVGSGISGGRAARPAGITPTELADNAPIIEMAHDAWYKLSAATQHCTLMSSSKASVIQTHLLISPTRALASGWLSAAEGCILRWPFGELAMPSGWSYIITLVQIGNVIQANALPVNLSPSV